MEQYRPFVDSRESDEMLLIAQHRTGSKAVRRLTQVSRALAKNLDSHWQTNPILAVSALRSGATLACMPSMLAKVAGKNQSKYIAPKVVKGLSVFYDKILGSELGDLEIAKERPDYNHVKGCLSELAILGTLWWGASQRHSPKGSYALPTLKHQDEGYVIDGARTGYDLTLYTPTAQRLIQVKSNKDFDTGPPYKPDHIVVEPRDLHETDPRLPYNPYVTSLALR